METEEHCPNCGNRLDAEALGGLCPICLLDVSASAHATASRTTRIEMNRSQDILPIELETGSQFGRYRIGHRIGYGGMGVVYEAEEIDSGRRVALKVIHQNLNSPHDRKRFLREGRLAASINHPNCVYVFGTEEINDIPVIVMELVTGGTLADRLHQPDPLPVAQTVDAILEIISGLEAAHTKGILHRDIKPSNCFESTEGALKIGDFGLSISTAARAESMVTQPGTMLGTPAYCPPEQLRGDELTFRTDMYAMGVMLYQLLTGQLPFAGNSTAQLIANVLEKPVLAPRKLRSVIPVGLSEAVLRCLKKQPTERFASYADLRQALLPYSSKASTPAPLGLRFLAGLLDIVMIVILFPTIIVLVSFVYIQIEGYVPVLSRKPWYFDLLPHFFFTLYYTISEWKWGASFGKAICQIRIRKTDGSQPGFFQIALRSALFILLPPLLGWLMKALSLSHYLTYGYLLKYLPVGLFFVTVRQRNGFAALTDLLLGTRVIRKPTLEQRAQLSRADTAPDLHQETQCIGPYHILSTLSRIGPVEWLKGYDLRLLRRVFIRKVPAGTPTWPASLCRQSRIGRLRWLAGQRGTDQNWDAFEGVGGQAFLNRVQTPQPWAQVRFWIHDLACELVAAEQDGSLPKTLTLDCLWLTDQGRIKLVDVPVCQPPEAKGASSPIHSQPAMALLYDVARVALAGVQTQYQRTVDLPLPLPIHAHKFLATLSDPDCQPQQVIQALRPLLSLPVHITRRKRALVTLTSTVIPLLAGLLILVVFLSQYTLEKQRNDLQVFATILRFWETKRESRPSDQDYGIYIATHYRELINKQETWSTPFAQTQISPSARAFAEESVEKYALVSTEQRAQSENNLADVVRKAHSYYEPIIREGQVGGILVWFFIYGSALPAILCALLFRRGLAVRASGVMFVCSNGRPASRLRLFWRALVAWGSLVLAIIASIACIVALKLLVLGLLCVGAIILLIMVSHLQNNRALPDRLAGTWPVPR
jgi:eukaryotic-like serine/threonine-protein kinase